MTNQHNFSPFILLVSVAQRALISHRASTALSRRKYCIGKEETSRQKQPPRSHGARTAQHGGLIFYRARADHIFLTALSPREFRCATEAASFYVYCGVLLIFNMMFKSKMRNGVIQEVDGDQIMLCQVKHKNISPIMFNKRVSSHLHPVGVKSRTDEWKKRKTRKTNVDLLHDVMWVRMTLF